MFVKSIFGVYTTNGFMLHTLCAFILGGKDQYQIPPVLHDYRLYKRYRFHGSKLLDRWLWGFSNNKGWEVCAGGINLCNIFGFSGATSFPNTGTRSRTQSSCWGLSTSSELGWCWVTSCSDHLSAHSHTFVFSPTFLEERCHFLHPLTSLTGACLFGNWKGRRLCCLKG